jgi:hypothetical protein
VGKIGNSLALLLLLVFIASLVALPQNVKALLEPTPDLNPALTINVTEVTDTSVTLSWTRDQPPAGFVSVSGVPYFNNYVLRMSNITLDSQYPYSRSNYEDVWTTLDSKQTTTTVTNLSSFTKYYFYILASDYFGGEFSNIVEVQTLLSLASSPNPMSTASTPTPTPTVPEFSWLAIFPLLLLILSLAVISGLRRKRYAVDW